MLVMVLRVALRCCRQGCVRMAQRIATSRCPHQSFTPRSVEHTRSLCADHTALHLHGSASSVLVYWCTGVQDLGYVFMFPQCSDLAGCGDVEQDPHDLSVFA